MKFNDKRFVKPALAAALLVAHVLPAQAAEKELLDILLGNGAITQSQYDELLAKEELAKEDVAALSFGNGSGLNVTSADGRYEVELGGRLHLDYVDHSYDEHMGAPVSGTQIRRGRIELNGRFDQSWAWTAEFDYAQDQVEAKDFKIGYVTESGYEFYAGHQKQPYSMSLEMSSNDISFVERSIDNYLVAEFTDRAIGLRGDAQGEHWFVAAGLFGEAMETGGPGDEGWGSSGRFVYAPVIEGNAVVHLGLRATYREIDSGSAPLRLRDKTSDFSSFSVVDTGMLSTATSVRMNGPEAAASFGPLFVFGEYSKADIARSGEPSLEFDGWHVAASWVLTGESYAERYRIDEGEFKNIRPAKPFSLRDGGIGAWEVAARLASIDLNDADIPGGEEDAVSLALNWYPNRNMRLMADWTRVIDTDESSLIRRYAPDTDILTLRTQWNY